MHDCLRAVSGSLSAFIPAVLLVIEFSVTKSNLQKTEQDLEYYLGGGACECCDADKRHSS